MHCQDHEHTYIYKYTYTHTHTCPSTANTHTHVHTHTDTCTHTRKCTHTHTLAHTHTHTHTCTHTRAHTCPATVTSTQAAYACATGRNSQKSEPGHKSYTNPVQQDISESAASACAWATRILKSLCPGTFTKNESHRDSFWESVCATLEFLKSQFPGASTV